jgi:dephospho-CoA kinase
MRLAIVGKMRSGKDTFAKYFTDLYEFKSLAFGNGITDVITRYFPEAFITSEKPREHYLKIGQSFRELDPDIWVEILADRLWEIEEYKGLDTDVIVTDCRQHNEYAWLKAKGFTIIKVEAEDEVRIERMAEKGEPFNPAQFYHDTEMATDTIPYDYLVTNNGPLGELIEQAEWVYREVKKDA